MAEHPPSGVARLLVPLILALALAVSAGSLGLTQAIFTDAPSLPDNVFSTADDFPPPPWWDENWLYRRELTITPGANTPYNGYDGYTAILTADSAGLIGAGKMNANCSDLRVLYWTGTWTELDRSITGCNTNSTTVLFKLQADIPASTANTDYFLYYGNPAATAGPLNPNKVFLFYDNFESQTEGSAPSGWTVVAGGTWVIRSESSAVATNQFLRREPTTSGHQFIKPGSAVAAINEKDIYVRASVRLTPGSGTDRICVLSRLSSDPLASIDLYQYCLNEQSGSKTIQIAKFVDGAGKRVSSSANAWADGTWHTLAGTAHATTLRISLNGASPGPVTDADVTGPGSAGLGAFQGSAIDYDFDDVIFRRYTEPEPTVSAGAEEVKP